METLTEINAQQATVKPICSESRELEQMLHAISPLFVEYLNRNHLSSEKVSHTLPPSELTSHMKFLDLPAETAHSTPHLVDIVKEIMQYSVRTGHPLCLEHSSSGPADPIGHIAELVTSVLNADVGASYSASPVASLIENKLIRELCVKFGFSTPESDEGEGITVPGGTIGTLLALLTARNSFFPDVKRDGMSALCLRPAILTSAAAHSSIEKAAVALGLGFSSVIRLPTNATGQILPEEVEKTILALRSENNTSPREVFFLHATAGITSTGAFDALAPLADICRKHNIWLHVDASWGGSAVFSPQACSLLNGIRHADSIVWSAHESPLGIPGQLSFLLLRKKGILESSNSLDESNLSLNLPSADLLTASTKKQDGSVDLLAPSKHSNLMLIQGGRRADMLKLWLSWQYNGAQGLQDKLRAAFDRASLFADLIRKRVSSGFELVIDPPPFLSVCFWYVPGALKGLSVQDRNRILSMLSSQIHVELIARGRVHVGLAELPAILQQNPITHASGSAQTTKEHLLPESVVPHTHDQYILPSFFRVVINNNHVREEDFRTIIDEIENIGENVYNSKFAAQVQELASKAKQQ